MRIVIIEDEKHIAADLANTLLSIDGQIEIVATLTSIANSLAFFEEGEKLDLIFADIQLGDGLSFEIFKKIPAHAPVIFCTAFNEYALEAFDANGIDYILKPFGKKTVGKSLQKFQNLRGDATPYNNDFTAIMKAMENRLHQKAQSILIRQGEKIIPLGLENIALFFVEDQYPFALTFEKKKYLVTQNLEQLEKSCGSLFYRANRQFLVNRKAIKDVSQYFNRKLLLNLNFPFEEKITVGKVKSSAFLEWLSSS